MVSPRPTPPLPVIKERTRALQEKLRRRTAQTALNTSTASSPSEQSQTTFHVIHSTPSEITSPVESGPVVPAKTALVSAADTAIARLRTYRDEQLLWHTAVEHRTRWIQRTVIHGWRLAVPFDSHSHLLSLASQLSEQHSARRLREAVRRWSWVARASGQHKQRHSHLSSFHNSHLQRVYFIAWVAHTLHRNNREVDTLLAQSIHRSNALRAGWRVWRETQTMATQQRVLEKRAQQHADVQLTQLTLAIWRAQGSQAVAEREKERTAALRGDGRSKRYYLRQWRQLPVMVRKDEEARPRFTQRTSQQLLREAWQAWREESEWRQAAQLVCDRLLQWRQQWLVTAAWQDWEGILDNENEDMARAQHANEWHGRQQLRGAVQQWRASTRDAKAQRLTDRRAQLELVRSLQHWRVWAHQQRLKQKAQRYYQDSSAAQALYWWRQQLQLSVNDRQMRERARAHEYERRMLAALTLWQRSARQYRQSNELMEAAASYERNRLLRAGLTALLANCRQRHTMRQHAFIISRHQLQSTVVLLYQHAVYQRHCWQLHLKAKRFRYFQLLRYGWHGWHGARQQEAAAEERLFTERCGGLVRDWTRQLFGAWLRLTSEQRLAREREVVALTQWSGRLIVDAWQEWQIAVLDRVDEQQLLRAADLSVVRNSQKYAVTKWLSCTRFKRQIREAESEAVAVGQQQLQLLARRRVWQQFQLAFHTSRAHCFDLNKADQHHNRGHLHHCLHQWRHYSSTSAHRSRLHSAATAAHGRRLLLLAWRHWLAIQTERRRLLTLHVRAMEWRKVREERRVWLAWQRWVHSRRAKRQREADMRRLRVERLQVEGVRQWVMVGLEWIQQKEGLEIEARRAQQKNEHEQSQQRRVQQEAVGRWVQRIAQHWRHRTAKKDEARQPLVTHTQLTRWREAEKERSKPHQLEQQNNAAGEGTQWSHIDEFATVPTAARSIRSTVSIQPPLTSSAVPPSVSRRARVRAEPRRHVELLLDEQFENVSAVPHTLDVSQSTAVPSHLHLQPLGPPRSPQSHMPSTMSTPAVDEALLAALSAPSIPSLDLTAIENRLQFLADLRSAYIHNKQELQRLQAASSTESNRPVGQFAQGSSVEADASYHARCTLLLHACLEFEQQRMHWKQEVQQWQTSLQRAQRSSG